MIKRIFITFFILIALYSVFVFLLSKKETKFFQAQNMWQENMIRMQEYVYSNKNYENILLGSSLTQRVSFDATTHPTFFSLAAGGGDPFIGLEIIKRSGKKPKRIYVETNFILTKSVHDETYLSSLYMPGFFDARKAIPALREENQPVNFLGKAFTFALDKTTKGTGDKKAQPNMIDTIARNRVFEKRYSDAEFEKNQAAIIKNTAILNDYIDYFSKIGVPICFFEMPRDCELYNEKLIVYARNAVDKIAAEKHLDKISFPACEGYITMDGLHLDNQSAARYSSYLFEQIKKNNWE